LEDETLPSTKFNMSRIFLHITFKLTVANPGHEAFRINAVADLNHPLHVRLLPAKVAFDQQAMRFMDYRNFLDSSQ
jgi:hypothetical protein